MKIATLLRAGFKTHGGTAFGVLLLFFLITLSLGTVLTVAAHSARYVEEELERLGYGDLTAWVSGLSDPAALTAEVTALDEVEAVGVQPVIFAEYEIGEKESDSEGQLITYEPERFAYRFFDDSLSGYRKAPEEIAPGNVYVSASMISMFGVRTGDLITFPIARSGQNITLRVAGFYEDPFMGSSMIGMKGFLVDEKVHAEAAGIIREAGIDGLAREGYMLHIVQVPGGGLSAAEFNTLLNAKTSLQRSVEFVHSREAISGFMLTLQNVFTSLLLSFTVILLMASAAVLSHSIGSVLEQDRTNMGILKTMGFTGGTLRTIQLLQYLIPTLGGMAAGMFAAAFASDLVCRMTVTTTGMLIPSSPPLGLCVSVLGAILIVLMGFIWFCTRRIRTVSPLCAIRGERKSFTSSKQILFPIRKKWLSFWLAIRQVSVGMRRYAGVCLVAALLVFFSSLIGRVNAWLGPDGEGLMDAFNPSDLHIAAQPMGKTGIEEVEQTISRYTAITDSYLLGMPGVSVNGVDMTANVITEPERFHLLSGRTCREPDEVVLTEFVASDLGVSIGDSVTVSGGRGSGIYTVSGIYQCANDMGINIGMSREGYQTIGEETPTMWCTHYFLEAPSRQPEIMQALQDAYGADVYLHENSWPGLFGILAAMHLLMIFLSVIVFLFVLIVTLMISGKLLRAERRDLSIYRTLGFSVMQLQYSFALRFTVVAVLGSVFGTCASTLFSDPLTAMLMRMEGISNFSSHPDLLTVLLPGSAVTILFFFFAFFAAGRIGRTSIGLQTET